jgi:hypothetical protein
MTSSNDEKLLDIALKADIETLYAVVGQIASKNRLGASPTDKQSMIESGRRWIKDKHNDLRGLVCNNPQITDMFLSRDRKVSDTRDLVLLVSDLIVSVCSGIPAIYIAALIVKIGLREWCDGET